MKLTITSAIFLLVTLSFSSISSAQQSTEINRKNLYSKDNLIHKKSDDGLFTGILENRRKNGHLVCVSTFKDGIILNCKRYYNGKKEIVANVTDYNASKPFLYKAYYKYNQNSELKEKESYDDNGELVLVEQFKDDKLVYSCEYKDLRKHGKELYYSELGKVVVAAQYSKGKKVKPSIQNQGYSIP